VYRILRRLSIGGRVLAVAAVGLIGSAGIMALDAQPAAAWSWSSTIYLSGTAFCPYATTNLVTGVWIHGSDGEQGWASLGSSGETRHYAFTFNSWPSGGDHSVSYWFGCSGLGSTSGSFGLARPAFGSGVQVNLPS
jgi:hypothetical protein